jgi:hypothetical protein
MTPDNEQSVMRILGRIEGTVNALDQKVDRGFDSLGGRLEKVEGKQDAYDREHDERRGRNHFVGGGVRSVLLYVLAPAAASGIVLILGSLIATHG